MRSLTTESLDDFLRPLSVETTLLVELARRFRDTYGRLAAKSEEQFLGTPVEEALLRPEGIEAGRYLAVDIGGTNLRVGFVELAGHGTADPMSQSSEGKPAVNGDASRVEHNQRTWPIGEKLKNEKAEDLFAWIGSCIAEVVEENLGTSLPLLDGELPMGVTFSFPMIQTSLAEAILMPMGKGFAITSNLDLSKQLTSGYITALSTRSTPLPHLKIVAITNDAVATLVAFIYKTSHVAARKAAMGLIVGTGINATIPLPLSALHPSKRPPGLPLDHKIVVNTEWSLDGAVAPLRDLALITPWDATLDAESAAPGFQPFEYMTSGRYLGELARIVILDYFTTHLRIPLLSLPHALATRNALTTAFLGTLTPGPSLLAQLERALPPPLPLPTDDAAPWRWSQHDADAVYTVTKTIQVRAAGLCAAAVVGLLACAGDLSLSGRGDEAASPPARAVVGRELSVGYTGGCIVHFQDYLRDCQGFLDGIVGLAGGDGARVVLRACSDGGIIGAGVLAGAVGSLP